MQRKLISFVLCALLITSGCLEGSPPDMDGDGIQDSEDIDIDGDGWSNSEELNCTSDPNDGDVVPTDTDGDSECDPIDIDDDGDSWSDTSEQICGTDPLDRDSVPDDLDGDMECDDWDDDADGMDFRTSGRYRGASTQWTQMTSSVATERQVTACGHMTTSHSQRLTMHTPQSRIRS